ncbi:MAG: peptidase C1 [Bacteroidetes bacterium]|nr:peptidase C1 [Bacteroidota bacterium]
MKQLFSAILVILILSSSILAQKKDIGIIKEGGNAFWDNIESSLDSFNEKKKAEKKIFEIDLSNFKIPGSVDEFKSGWHNEPVSQGATNTCWSYSTTSFFESEIFRIHGKKIKLSSLWTAYWEFLEKTEEYVNTRGESYFAEGSEANAVTRIWNKYGVVPEEAYSGVLPDQPFPDHRAMFAEMELYLGTVKATGAWNMKSVLGTITCMMNKYMGTPPSEFIVDGVTYTPKTYLDKVVNLKLDDYVDVVNYLQQPLWEQVEYEVPDNWWHSKDYHNVPLANFMKIIKNAVRKGYTISIGGDVSESGKVGDMDVCVIPSYDIPSQYIDDYAKQFRFSNETTTDDHGVHLVGYKEIDGVDWYLIKDSGSSARNGKHKGYYFFHEDYVKLKMMDIMVHKDVAEEFLSK